MLVDIIRVSQLQTLHALFVKYKCLPVDEEEEGDLIHPESEEDDDDDDVLTVVDEETSTDDLARNAAASVGVSRVQNSGSKKANSSTGKGKKRTSPQGPEEPQAKKKSSSKFIYEK